MVKWTDDYYNVKKKTAECPSCRGTMNLIERSGRFECDTCHRWDFKEVVFSRGK